MPGQRIVGERNHVGERAKVEPRNGDYVTPPKAGDLCTGGFAFGFAAATQKHGGFAPCQQLGRLEPDTTVGAGDQDDFALHPSVRHRWLELGKAISDQVSDAACEQGEDHALASSLVHVARNQLRDNEPKHRPNALERQHPVHRIPEDTEYDEAAAPEQHHKMHEI